MWIVTERCQTDNVFFFQLSLKYNNLGLCGSGLPLGIFQEEALERTQSSPEGFYILSDLATLWDLPGGAAETDVWVSLLVLLRPRPVHRQME